jgi:N-acetylmuramoyl-L-alanine amidase
MVSGRLWVRGAGVLAVLVVAAGCAGDVAPRADAHRRSRSTTTIHAASRAEPPAAAAQEPTTGARPTNTGWSPDLTPAGRLVGKRICVDPGHDAVWGVGATGKDRQGQVPTHPTEGIPLFEHELTLSIAYKLVQLLVDEGAQVCVTRREDGSLQLEPHDFTGDGQVRPDGIALEDGPERSQPRIEWANQFGADVLVSIHFNGLADPTVRGTEVYYSDTGPRADDGLALANALLAALVEELGVHGHDAVNRGVRSDRYQRYPPDVQAAFRRNNAPTILRNGFDPADCPDCQRIGVLGNNPMSLNRGAYIAALVEIEFLSNPNVVEELLMRPDSIDIIATGLAKGLLAYFDAQ